MIKTQRLIRICITSSFPLIFATGLQAQKIFTRDNTVQIVTDHNTGLMWQDDKNISLYWDEAITYCENLNLGGYDDWRLPNINELISIVDYTKYDDAIYDIFENNNKYNTFHDYWSSTTVGNQTKIAITVQFLTGRISTHASDGVNNGNKLDFKYNVRCVRGGR